jgi:hypothetical protein
MTFPTVTERPAQLEPVSHDPFNDRGTHVADAARAAAWRWPRRRPADA